MSAPWRCEFLRNWRRYKRIGRDRQRDRGGLNSRTNEAG